jgi:hypothetical protein
MEVVQWVFTSVSTSIFGHPGTVQTVGVHSDNDEPENFTFVAKPLMTEQCSLSCSLVMFDTRMISGVISNSFSSCRVYD